MKRTSSTRDRFVLCLASFYVFMAVTVEAHWLLSYRTLGQRSDFVGRFWSFYGRADTGYYNAVSSFVIGLESFQVFFSVWLYLLLIWAVLHDKSFRYPLQLAVSSYICYSTTLYLLSNHLSGYAGMQRHTLPNFLMLYLPNLPWLLGNLLLAADAFAAITRRLQEADRDLPEAAG